MYTGGLKSTEKNNYMLEEKLYTFVERLATDLKIINMRDHWKRPPLHHYLAEQSPKFELIDLYSFLDKVLLHSDNLIVNDINGWNVLHEVAIVSKKYTTDQAEGMTCLNRESRVQTQPNHVKLQLRSAEDKFGRTPADLLPFRFTHKEEHFSSLLGNLEPCPPTDDLLLFLSVTRSHQTSHYPDAIKVIQDLGEGTSTERPNWPR